MPGAKGNAFDTGTPLPAGIPLLTGTPLYAGAPLTRRLFIECFRAMSRAPINWYGESSNGDEVFGIGDRVFIIGVDACSIGDGVFSIWDGKGTGGK